MCRRVAWLELATKDWIGIRGGSKMGAQPFLKRGVIMTYRVLARKWRPQTWDELIAQEHVTATLKNAIQHNRLAHAYLFTGPRGVGKTSAARILAKALKVLL
jgi:replication-associated recombination protein RarA